MTPSDAEVTPMAGRTHAAPPTAATRQLLAVGIDRGRLEGIAALTSPHVNVFVTSSPHKALVWTRLEPLDLILLRFGPPVEQALDLLQALIEANPAPPIALLVEPEGEPVAQRLTDRQICVALPASLTPEQLTQQVRRLLGPSVAGRPAASRHVETAQPAPFMPGVQPVPLPSAAGHPPQDEQTSRRVAITAETHRSPPPPPPAAAPSTAAAVAVSAGPPAGAATSAPHGWELPFLDQLVIELAHRLKNPLVSIKTFTHLLQERFNDADFRTRFYTIVNNDVVQLNEVVDRLMEFTEFSRPYPKPLNPADELKQVVESIEPSLQSRQVTVHVASSDELAEPAVIQPQLFADPMQFRYLLKQLLLDSASAAAAGGRLQIRLHGRPVGRDEAEPTCTVQIDSIMASTAPRLHEWLSLELLLAKNLMERHRGTVTVTVSGGANGTQRLRRVTATFPLNAQPRQDAHPQPSEPRTTPATLDRRRFPLSIAFRERRLSSRRQVHRSIPFSDRRRPPEGKEGIRSFHLYEDRPRPGSSPPSATI